MPLRTSGRVGVPMTRTVGDGTAVKLEIAFRKIFSTKDLINIGQNEPIISSDQSSEILVFFSIATR